MIKTFFYPACKAVFILLLLVAVSSSVQAQKKSTAQLNDDLSILLDTNEPVSTTYEADISHYASNTADQQKADQFIKQFERPYAKMEVDLKNHKVTITLELNAVTSGWSVEKWNEYLKSN